MNNPQITIELDRSNLAIKVSGSVPSLDVALNMLAQATREYKELWRAQRAKEALMQKLEAQRIASLTRGIGKPQG